MSQEKVERYKKEKANRKQTLKKEKAQSMAIRTAGVVLCAALLGWIGYSGYIKWESAQPIKSTEITLDPITEYMNGLSSEEAAE